MNRSGDAVSAARDYFNLSLDDILLVSDDVDLPVGTIRMRASGSAGGHKGLEDCLKKLGGSAISRLRVGVGRSDGGADTADYVLSAPITEEKEELRSSARSAAKAAELWLKVGPELAMNEVNKEMWS
jgi:PTH1 family peptidyl-tRNA hydrolase